MKRKFLYGGLAAALLFSALLSIAKRQHPSQGFAVRVVSDTCSCSPLGSQRLIHLHLSKDGSLTINQEVVQANRLGTLLSNIYAVRAERVLYVSTDSDVPFENFAQIIDLTQNLEFPHSVPQPSAPKNLEPMRVEVRLVTKRAIDKNCPAACFNWVKQPLLLPAGGL